MAETRAMPVPDGLAGERVDAAIARLLGLSRTRAAEIAAAGGVRLDGVAVGKSDRMLPGGWLEVELPEVAAPGADVVPEPVPGMRIVHDDDDGRSPKAISIVVAQSQRVEGLGGPRRVTAHIWTPIGKTRARLSSSLARRRRSKKIKGQTAAPSCPRCGIRWLPNAPF